MVELADLNLSEDVRNLNPQFKEQKPKKPSKYRNVRQTINGMTFDSKKEAEDAQNFMTAVWAGEYISYQHHVIFPLPGGINYEADHTLINKKLEVEVYDTKTLGTVTKEFKLKAKLFREVYGRDIKLI